MDLTPYLVTLQEDLETAAAPGGVDTTLLSRALTASARLVLLEALSDAAAEITSRLAATSVEVRLRGRDADLVVTEAAPEPAPAAAQVSMDGDLTRLTLRMPETLKDRVESTAAAEGLSVNAWLVRAVSTALGAAAPPPSGGKHGKRVTGYFQA
jgi:hypothetical protein